MKMHAYTLVYCTVFRHSKRTKHRYLSEREIFEILNSILKSFFKLLQLRYLATSPRKATNIGIFFLSVTQIITLVHLIEN